MIFVFPPLRQLSLLPGAAHKWTLGLATSRGPILDEERHVRVRSSHSPKGSKQACRRGGADVMKILGQLRCRRNIMWRTNARDPKLRIASARSRGAVALGSNGCSANPHKGSPRRIAIVEGDGER